MAVPSEQVLQEPSGAGCGCRSPRAFFHMQQKSRRDGGEEESDSVNQPMVGVLCSHPSLSLAGVPCRDTRVRYGPKNRAAVPSRDDKTRDADAAKSPSLCPAWQLLTLPRSLDDCPARAGAAAAAADGPRRAGAGRDGLRGRDGCPCFAAVGQERQSVLQVHAHGGAWRPHMSEAPTPH
eukprot:scaffold388_cov380-Prasinococcus_capsulatus_cf.AAC.20